MGEALTRTLVCALKTTPSHGNHDDWLNPTEVRQVSGARGRLSAVRPVCQEKHSCRHLHRNSDEAFTLATVC